MIWLREILSYCMLNEFLVSLLYAQQRQ